MPFLLQPQHRRARLLLLLACGTSVVMGMVAVGHQMSVTLEEKGWPRLASLFERVHEPLLLVEWKLQDLIHRSATPAAIRSEIIVLGIDDASLELRSAFPEDIEKSRALQLMQKGWPWSRGIYAELVPKLINAGAHCVMLDLMFTGPSAEFPDDDAALRKVLERYPDKVVLAASFTDSMGVNGVTTMLQKPWDGLVADTHPPPPSVGFINYWSDADQVVRSARFHRSIQFEDSNRRDLAHLDLMHSAPAAALEFAKMNSAVPVDDQARRIRFSDAGAYPSLSLHELFVPEMWDSNFAKGGAFKDKIVLIGNVTPHMQDFHNTPVGRLAGVQIHAQVIGAALNQQFLRVLPWWVALLLIGGAALLAWILVTFWKQPVGVFIVLIVGTGGGIAFAWLLFDQANIIVDAVAPLITFSFAGIIGLTYDFLLERRQRKQLGSYLARYLSPDLVAVMLRDPAHLLTLQRGAHRTITVLFSDLRGFTSLSEKLTPQQLVTQLNQYFNRMVAVIHGHRGGIDKFIGDAIMAVWGWVGFESTPESVRQDAVEAVTTILRMRQSLDELNREWRDAGIGELKIGIGINQGEAIVGDLGSEKQSGFTVIGDSVNTASRLEGITKEYGVDNVISEVVWNQVKDNFVCRSTDLVRVKGKLIPTPIFTVIHGAEIAAPSGLASYEQAVADYRRGEFAKAKAGFEVAASLDLNDELTRLYLKRCESCLESPPAEWDGVYVMTKK